VAGSELVTGLDQAVDEYLAVRRALGFKLEKAEVFLRDFVRYLDQQGEQQITTRTAVTWAVLPGGSQSRHYARLAAVRLFAGYLHAVDPSVEIPGIELLQNGPSRRRPFLYTDDEIIALIAAAGSLKTPHRRATYRTLIGLLAVSGMRVGEAIGLDLGDFDPAPGVLVVRGKLDKIRELPLTPCSVDALNAYLGRGDRPPSPSGERALFISTPGTRLELHGVELTFSLLRERVGITSRFGSRPTLHGLRHTFAIRTMLDAYEQDLDAGARLGVLATFIGHIAPANTYWYLQAVPELMSVAARRLEHHEGHER